MKRVQSVILCAVMLVTLLALLSCAGRTHRLIYQSGLTVWMLDPEKGTRKPLVKSATYAVGLSSDLKRVAYSTDSYDLWVADIDGTNARQVITDQLREAGLGIARVSWSPGGERLAVWATPVEDPQSNLEKLALYIVDLSTDDVQMVATGVTAFAWTRAGDQLVGIKQFVPEESPGVYLISVDGSASRLLFEGLIEPYVTISPVSDKAAFVTDRPGRELDLSLLVVDLVSGDVTDLLQDFDLPFRGVGDLAWSPDGKHLAFIAMLAGGEGPAAQFVLFMIDPQTRALQELAQDIRGPLAWSPTGHAIATTLMSSTEGIYQVSVETGDIQKLTDDRLLVPMNFEWR